MEVTERGGLGGVGEGLLLLLLLLGSLLLGSLLLLGDLLLYGGGIGGYPCGGVGVIRNRGDYALEVGGVPGGEWGGEYGRVGGWEGGVESRWWGGGGWGLLG